MGDPPDRLHVPDPDDVGPDGEGPMETLALAGVLSIMFTLAVALVSIPNADETKHESQPRSTSGTDSTSTDNKPSPSRKLARRLASKDKETVDEIAWTTEQIDAVVRHGPRRLAEAACRATYRGESDVSARSLGADLLSLVDRRAEQTPWSCLFRQYLEDELSGQPGLKEELAPLWTSTMRMFQSSDVPVASVVADWHPQVHGRPDNPKINPWLRLCAAQYDYQAAEACQAVLSAIAPEQGRDLLMAIETHLRETEPLNPSYDLPIVVDGLGALAELGQPDGWRIKETDVMPDYDADIRVAATFFLCRFVNSPNESIARQAAAELTNASGFSVRMVNASLRRRWLRSCKLAFRTGGTEESPEAPALAVWNGDPDSSPNYTLKSAIQRGDCDADGPEPAWYCAISQYRGMFIDDLDDFFVESRGLQSHQAEW